MRIIGGTYVEVTKEPSTEHIYGSGLRAAAALSHVIRPHFITCLDSRLRSPTEGLAATFGIDLEVVDRDYPVIFSYYTPLSTPDVFGGNQAKRHIVSDDASSSALVFGMLEADCSVNALGIVYDPQGSQDDLVVDRNSLVASRFAIVANIHEIRILGRSDNIVEAARRVMDETVADVVVVKRGALGCLIVEPDGSTTPIGPYQTESVWPIGSGDVFSAVFAWAWLESNKDPQSAATLASAATAVWCGTQTLPILLSHSADASALMPGIALTPGEEGVPIYLAGPFFNLGQRWLVNLVRRALTHLGAHVFSPLHDVGTGGDAVAERDLEGLMASKAIFGLLDGADAGTLYEFGYAAAHDIPAIGYAALPDGEDFTMIRGTGTIIGSDLASAVYQTIWAGMR